ncbi:Ubiquitin carboxyl-terminal hydrolase 2 [Sesamum angolense]|uniref:ubiquitinyl hydrolase 1 n=1 Tax=Sesamum angolense TaxID=2727404 RepID=A0AAE1X7D7_9LAMI|nr:Ubiquitin carboxyl-terminal hydrolase 2 [Sesamum angolense]
MIETYVSTAAQVFAGNVNLEAAANWIVKHENEPDIDQMPLVHVSSETPEAPKTSITQEEVKQEEQELREHCKKIEEDKQTEKEREKAIMGKKVKKKTRSGQKEKQGPSTSPRTVSQQGTSNVETPDDGVAGIKDRGLCSHLDRGINLEKLSAKLRSSESLKCEDCRGSVVDRRAKKGKGKHGKKGGTNSKPESKAIWICLECGHFSCGGVGLPTTPQSHAVRHAKQNHHPLVLHYENHQQLWCFPCNKLIPAEKSEDNKHKEVLNEVVKLLKGRPGEGSTLDVEDVWFGSGSVTTAIKSDYSASIGADGKAGYSIRGLVNLGNTCFFNSIMQNLLAITSLRDYFFKLDESVGSLTAALRKLFLETMGEAGLKSVINPRSLFGSLCTKAPQFRGYQQHDSHELLRCLLDGLSTEELSARKHAKSPQASIADPTFVDIIFGGRLSSTVSCLECGHSSTIYEPFLDLSLPVPTKKPPARRIQSVTRGKKPKMPPKKSGRNPSKNSREACSIPGQSVSDQSTGGNSLGEMQSIAPPAEQSVLALGDSALSDPSNPNNIALDMGFTAQDLSAIQNRQAVQNREQSSPSDNFTWLDYLDPSPDSHDIAITLETDEIAVIQGFANEDILPNDASLSITFNSSIESTSANAVSATSLDIAENLNSIEPGALAQQQNAFSQFEYKQNVEQQMDERLSPEVSFTVGEYDTDIGHSSDNPVCSKDSNTSGRDNENALQIQDSEVILLPYKEDDSSNVELLRAEIDISPAVLGDEQSSLDFDGFGDLFNEPEVSVQHKPSNHPVSEASDTAKNGVMGNSSESDPDEVDNADAPVSVESCLTFFMKPELLSKDEHAWQCDNCSKVLREQRIRMRRKSRIPISEVMPNGYENGNPSGLLDVGKTCNKVKSRTGDVEEYVVDPSDGRSVPQNREINVNGKCMLEKDPDPGTEINLINFQSEITEPQVVTSCHGQLESSSSSNQNLNPCLGKYDSDNGFTESDILSAKSESELGEQEEVNSENVKVKRDATKSILINKAPSILTIHLKRFSQDARGRLSKLNGHVNFKETIDLKPYMDPRCADKDTFIYRLVGVVEHTGSMRGGHYIAYVRGTKNFGECVWYHASDAYVREASLEEVLRSEAYVLFYEGT